MRKSREKTDNTNRKNRTGITGQRFINTDDMYNVFNEKIENDGK